jgi:hypothetical protein
MHMLMNRLSQPLDDRQEDRIYDLMDKILDKHRGLAGFSRTEPQVVREAKFRLERQLVFFKLGAAVLVFSGGIVLALNGFQDIELFMLGCAASLLAESMVSQK